MYLLYSRTLLLMSANDAAAKFANQSTRQSAYQSRVHRGRLDPSLIPHGTLGGYSNWGCRCEECRGAERAYYNARRTEEIAEAFTAPAEVHGLSRYNDAGCRCRVCVEAVHVELARHGITFPPEPWCGCSSCVAHAAAELL